MSRSILQLCLQRGIDCARNIRQCVRCSCDDGDDLVSYVDSGKVVDTKLGRCFEKAVIVSLNLGLSWNVAPSEGAKRILDVFFLNQDNALITTHGRART